MPTKPPKSADPKVSIQPLDKFRPDPANANGHTPRGSAMMGDALREVGYGDSMVASADRQILSGGQRLESVADIGMHEAIVIETDGRRPVIHVRTDLKAKSARAKKLALYANRVGQVNLSWDADVLRAFRDDGVDLAALWTDDELAKLLGEAAAGSGEGAGTNEVGDLSYQLVVQCTSEQQQAALLERLEAEGYVCKVLTI